MSKNAYFKQAFSFWGELDINEKNRIEQESVKVSYSKNTLLHRSEDGCKGAILLLSGQFRIYIISDEGREVTLYRVRKGEACVLSASCLLDSLIFDVLIEAVEDTEAIIIPSTVLHQVMKAEPKVELFLYKAATERFSDVMWTMQQILFMGADKRVAIFLWDEMTKSGEMTLRYTHEEIAKYIGSAREVVTRILKYFVQEGVVSLSRGKIAILNKNKLKNYL